MPIVYKLWIIRANLQAEPEARFVFGDNSQRLGYGGQAREMRGEPNAIGVATKRRPGMRPDDFFQDNNEADELYLVNDLCLVEIAIASGRIVYVPQGGLGTGLSRLPEKAPELYHKLFSFFNENSLNCPWPKS